VAGLIRDEDIALVRERSRIDEVVADYVTLRNAGGGSQKGLCPFHDEKSPSFNVNPSRGFFHCLAGETEVLTFDGPREIRELAGGTHKVLGREADWVEAPFRSFGVQRLQKITLTRNRQTKEIFATTGHRWFVRSGMDGRREVLTSELKQGDSLCCVYPRSEVDPAPPTPSAWVVQAVQETEREEEVFCAEVEDGHAFALADNILTGNCFGCGEGGDVISFLQKMEGLSFADTVERLADRYGVQLRYTEGERPQKRESNLRPKLLEAHKVAAAYYADQLASPDAMVGRQFLSERGFDRDAAAKFGIGFAPRDGDALYKHLRQKGFRDEELVTGGLVSEGRTGHYDRFRGRLLWPIREASGDVIGFGARRLFDDDRIEAKYLNTAETPIYKKSHVLYGIDLARRDIARSSQAVVVEGYTDVMACHLSGVPTAVATCGTAFGEDHTRVLRRLLNDHEEFRGEVIFTFDGDEAGQRAALRAFGGDQQFVGQTYVAVEPDGLDPCDVRLQKGDAAVRELVARRIPLYRFVLSNVVGRYDLDRADGRIDALREAAKLVSSIRDRSKVDAFARELAGMVGVDPDQARAEVRRAAGRPARNEERRQPAGQQRSAPVEDAPAAPPLPDLRDPRFALERETLKLVVQHPDVVGRTARDVDADDFMHPAYRAVWQAVVDCGGPAGAPAGEVWVNKLRHSVSGEPVAQALSALAVEPLLSTKEPDAAYVAAHVYRLQEVTAMRRINDVKSRLQRTNPVEAAAEYNRMFGELVALEQHRRALREKAIGGEG
jgi:DNA primase